MIKIEKKKSSKRGKNRRNKTYHLPYQLVFTFKENPFYPPLLLPQSLPTKEEIKKIVEKLISKPKLGRFPNSFIIYRNVYVKYLKDNGHNIPMTELSPMLSHSWNMEPPYVKEAYSEISKEIERQYKRITKKNKPPQNQSLSNGSFPETLQPPTGEPNFHNGVFSYSSSEPIFSWSPNPLDYQSPHVEYIDVSPNQLIYSPDTYGFPPLFSVNAGLFSNITSDISYGGCSTLSPGINHHFNINHVI
ncbi:8445_t:CDS:1 [Acaulospora morrowiae]|uniref:8445_t:CDS:1 n=1 Tax=Acaulospora morrowiae TaxID=94023 RepID=A0A9N8Z176_9GLOM|nr:8445_t:CDS:1 [Acaulospora morrowiae]